jgi:hypothetical protein
MVLFITDLFHPYNDFTVELFLNGDMCHGRGRRGTMPMLFLRRVPDHIAWSYVHFWTAFTLHPSTPGCDDHGLPKRVGVPCRPSARLACHASAKDTPRSRCLEERINPHVAGKIGCPFVEGCEPLRLISIASFLHFIKRSESWCRASRRTQRCGARAS